MLSAQENEDAECGGEGLGGEGGHGRAAHALGGDGAPAEDVEGIKEEIEEDGAGDDHEGHFGLPHAAHESLKDVVEEDKDDADERHAHEAEGVVVDHRGDAEKIQEVGREQVARAAEDEGGKSDHHHGLCGDVVHHFRPSRAHVLGG